MIILYFQIRCSTENVTMKKFKTKGELKAGDLYSIFQIIRDIILKIHLMMRIFM